MKTRRGFLNRWPAAATVLDVVSRVHSTIPFAIVPQYVVMASPAAVKVYCALALRADHTTGECWPSRQTIARDTGLSVATVKRSLRELAAIGAISVRERFGESGDQTSNLYQLAFAINKGGSPTTRGEVTHDPTPGSPMTPKLDSDEPYIASLVENLPREATEHIGDYLRRLAER